MTIGRRAPQDDPTGERTADQSTQDAAGLHKSTDGIRPGPGPEVAARNTDDTDYRNDEDLYETPRRYDSGGKDDDPVMPSNDSSLNTKL